MVLGDAGIGPQGHTLTRSVGILSSQRTIANVVYCQLLALGVQPEVLAAGELNGIDVLIVAESTIGAAVLSVEGVRRSGYRMPLMVITSDNDPAAIERALGAGADEFVNISHRGAELPYRLTAIRRRVSGIWTRTGLEEAPEVLPASPSREECAPISTRGIEVVHGVRIVLTGRELSMLEYLRARPRVWVTAAELLAAVCDCPAQRDSTLVRVHLSAVRKKFGAYAYLIESRRTYGYRWVGAPTDHGDSCVGSTSLT